MLSKWRIKKSGKMKEHTGKVQWVQQLSVYVFEYKALSLLTFHFTILNNTRTHLPHLPLILWVPACTPAFPLLLKVSMLFKYNLNREGAKGSYHHFKLINPPLMLTGIEMMMHSWSWSKTHISHFNLIWRNKQRPLNREKNLVGEGTHRGGILL